MIDDLKEAWVRDENERLIPTLAYLEPYLRNPKDTTEKYKLQIRKEVDSALQGLTDSPLQRQLFKTRIEQDHAGRLKEWNAPRQIPPSQTKDDSSLIYAPLKVKVELEEELEEIARKKKESQRIKDPRLLEIFKEYQDKINSQRPITDYQCKIETQPGKIVQCKPYRQSYASTLQVRERVAEFEKLDIIEESYSKRDSPIVCVPKKNGQIRMCVDFTEVNKITSKDHFVFPNTDDLIYDVGREKPKYFTTPDLTKGFHQMEPKRHSSPKNTRCNTNAYPLNGSMPPQCFNTYFTPFLERRSKPKKLSYTSMTSSYSLTISKNITR